LEHCPNRGGELKIIAAGRKDPHAPGLAGQGTAPARAVEQGLWQPQEMPFAQMPQRFGYLLVPQV